MILTLFAYFVCAYGSIFVCSDIFDIFHSFGRYVIVLGVFSVLTVLTVHTGVGLFMGVFVENYDCFHSFSGRGLFWVIC